MKHLFLVPAALTFFGANVALADGGAGPTQFTMWETELAQKAHPTTPTVTPTGAVGVYGASQSRGTWLFAPSDGGGNNN